MTSKKGELAEKERRLRQLLEARGLDAALINLQAGFAWLTGGGDNHVLTATERGAVSLLVTRERKVIIADAIEALRVMEEELGGQGWELERYPWHGGGRARVLERITRGLKVGSDDGAPGTVAIGPELATLRFSLTREEIERYREVGRLTGKYLGEAAREVKPGDTEFEIAGRMSEVFLSSGVYPVVTLVAVDDRISKFRHPIPTEKKVRRCAMLVVCGRRWGLICSATRLVHFGKIPKELRAKHDAVVRVDTCLISLTIPGVAIGKIVERGRQAYSALGYAKEFELHHQGGPAGYAARDFKGEPGERRMVQVGQAFAWNPSITGTKSEDTIIARKAGPEILTTTRPWPMIKAEYEGVTLARPDILVL